MLGNLICTIKGDESLPSIILFAHMDQLGFVVKKIEDGVDFIIGADNYVASIQPDKNKENRYEQGVMVSMVDQEGNLLPQQKNARGILPAPTLIRKGLDNDKIIKLLCDHFNTWDYRQGSYY